MSKIFEKGESIKNNNKSLSTNIIDNKDILYPLLIYIAGLILGSIVYSNISDTKLSELMKEVFVSTQDSFDAIFFNKFCVSFSLFCLTVLLGLCLIGYPFVNIIPFLSGFVISLKTAFYYVNYSVKGIGYSLLIIIPECSALIVILLYTIKTSSKLSKNIYNLTAKKSDMTEEINLKSYLKSFLLYGLIVTIISLANALAIYLLSSIIAI